MPGILGPLVLSAAGTAVGTFFQNRSARMKRDRQQLADELRRAEEISNEISGVLDGLRYHFEGGPLYVAVRKAKGDQSRAESDRKTWDHYEADLMTWMKNRSRFTAKTGRYFGEESGALLKEIEDIVDDAESLVESTYYGRKRSLVKKDRIEYSRFFDMVEPLQHKVTELHDLMVAKIQDQSVGALPEKSGSRFSFLRSS